MSSLDTPRSCFADAAIAKNKIVKLVDPGAGAGSPAIEISGAAGTGHIPYGVSHDAAAAAGDVIPVTRARGNTAYVTLGGTVAQGDPLESDASGDAIKAAGASSYIVGWALEAGVDTDIIKMEVDPQFITLA